MLGYCDDMMLHARHWAGGCMDLCKRANGSYLVCCKWTCCVGCDADEEGVGRGQASQNVWKHIVWAAGALDRGPMIC